MITLREIIEDITAMSTLTKGDALNAIENFLDLIPKYVRKGHIVNLGHRLGKPSRAANSLGRTMTETFVV